MREISSETVDDPVPGLSIIAAMATVSTAAFEVVVFGGGPVGVIAELLSARLGARTAVVTRDTFAGAAANDWPVRVRTRAQTARLIREARQPPCYGITTGSLTLDYARPLYRVREVTAEARTRSPLRDDLERAADARPPDPRNRPIDRREP
jgi:hypothetical protein